jgi:hypothetical protein
VSVQLPFERARQIGFGDCDESVTVVLVFAPSLRVRLQPLVLCTMRAQHLASIRAFVAIQLGLHSFVIDVSWALSHAAMVWAARLCPMHQARVLDFCASGVSVVMRLIWTMGAVPRLPKHQESQGWQMVRLPG